LNRARIAEQQRRADIPFQVGDLCAQCRLGYQKFLGRLREVGSSAESVGRFQYMEV
jgi:hypothetical protein